MGITLQYCRVSTCVGAWEWEKIYNVSCLQLSFVFVRVYSLMYSADGGQRRKTIFCYFLRYRIAWKHYSCLHYIIYQPSQKLLLNMGMRGENKWHTSSLSKPRPCTPKRSYFHFLFSYFSSFNIICSKPDLTAYVR